jgi:hypothetical protein
MRLAIMAKGKTIRSFDYLLVAVGLPLGQVKELCFFNMLRGVVIIIYNLKLFQLGK